MQAECGQAFYSCLLLTVELQKIREFLQFFLLFVREAHHSCGDGGVTR